MLNSRAAVALLLASLVGLSGVGPCCTATAEAETTPRECCPSGAGFAEARLLCCESPSAARAVSQDANLTAPQATAPHPLHSSPAPGALRPPVLVHVTPTTPQPPASSPILRI